MKFDLLPNRSLPTVPKKLSLPQPALIVAVLLLAIVPLTAAPVEYEGSYNPAGRMQDRFAPDHTAGDNTDADPVWQWNPSNDPPEPEVREVDGMWALSYDSTADPIFGSTWTIGQNQTNSMAWNSQPGEGTTVDVTLRVRKGELYVRVGNSAGFNYVIFRPDRVLVTGAEGNQFAKMDNTAFRTYRIVRKDGQATVYVAGDETPLISEWAETPSTKFNELLFGDASATSIGAWDLANLSWTNAEAEFSAPESFDPGP